MARAPVSKTGGWGFESLQSCCYKKKMKNLINKVIQFLKDVRFELGKVTWPSRRELLGSTVIVMIMSVIVSIFIGVVDLGFSNLVSFIFGRG